MKMDPKDYLAISGLVKAKEAKFLTQSAIDKLVQTPDVRSFVAELRKYGYMIPENVSSSLDILSFFSKCRQDILNQANQMLPAFLYRFFCLDDDFHNIRIILKTEAGVQLERDIFKDCGTVPINILKQAVISKQTTGIPLWLGRLLKDLSQIPDKETGLKLKIVLRHQVKIKNDILRNTSIALLSNYAALETDLYNIMVYLNGKTFPHEHPDWKQFLEEKGNISIKSYGDDETLKATVKRVYPTLEIPITGEQFEQQSTQLRMKILRQARYLPDGIEVIFAYILAKEIEILGLQRLCLAKLYGTDYSVLDSWKFPPYFAR